ncbi:MAG: hypothetical protein QCI00_05875 [Candidatus Thermoplasmatota archaeon]|nr:hypothetical protein [Candidatus Thermoplasmatota archaeon]
MLIRRCLHYIFITTLLFSSVIIVSAAGLEITNTNYVLIEERSDEGAQFYNIFITIKNTHDDRYENITIELLDEFDMPVRQEYSFEPSEIKTFRFDNYPVAGGTIHQITVNVYPTDSDLRTPGNSPTTTFLLEYQGSTVDETSFLPLVALLFTILFVGFLIRRKEYQ